ncbi:MAG: 2-oxo-4-hydroxy-4-carboxy-5-ureidoimidazoline decarboxylase [Rhodospirillaceae bacterium]|nr:2-oxo-4-hydroxy-4-carboxy-5-ureidoimidazoline decarboxylase [Rhodospirillaceae bacterium]MYF87279.1 2-oxo-4-hydroxy-4-carboxy-5-ureidoimidazoline decarboxylase [Rhodospirillaceae bacterium]MYH37793.1 2-oxo-4-hydroxy-4-carboxy-5-ureidoimidazoline decarboxylase [Rhodospirillaceae bacterium]MYK15370.1 2-oxo-4-hydroxy-4-carboxy-5-ureidoimidazoline decarboxylase [Rhodospirillaceae bacterium]MYK58222.1 2-oxo-4-hydroxy-4-carboxy-5-ureidoimidazoline decarboxylase [Rhodospirillaceae bacterium]
MLSPRPSSLDRAAFVEAYGGVYEHSPWVAETVYDAGIGPADDTAAALAGRMGQVVDAADGGVRLALLRAHPELAGRLAVAGNLTVDSTAEQASAGLDRCTPEEFVEFHALNERYTARFGFPFIVAVRGLSRQDILDAFRSRAGNVRETEFATALQQVHRIARLRLEAMEG